MRPRSCSGSSSAMASGFRHHRGLTDQLESDLWIWRTECRSAGKKVPKRLVQARAKWSFHQRGMPEFKASDGWYWKWLSKWKKKSSGPSPNQELVSPQSNSVVQLDNLQNTGMVKMIGSQSPKINALVNCQQVKGLSCQDIQDGIHYPVSKWNEDTLEEDRATPNDGNLQQMTKFETTTKNPDRIKISQHETDDEMSTDVSTTTSSITITPVTNSSNNKSNNNTDTHQIISMSAELQREAGEYLASLRIRERPNNGVRLLIDDTPTLLKAEEILSKVVNVEMNNNQEMNVDDSESEDEIWQGIASHLLTSDEDIVTLDLVSNDDDLMPADLMTCEATVDTLVKLDPNSLATLLDMVDAESCNSSNNSSIHNKRDEEGHVPCPCQTCIDVQSSNETAEKETFDLLENSDNLSIHHLDSRSVDMLSQAYSSHATSPMSATSHMSAYSHETSSIDMSPHVVSSSIDDANLMEEGKMETFTTKLVAENSNETNCATSKALTNLLIQDLKKEEDSEDGQDRRETDVTKTVNEPANDTLWKSKQFSPLPPLILPSSPIDKGLLMSKGVTCFGLFSPASSSSSQISSPSPSQQWSPGSSKENHDPSDSGESASKKKRLSVIAQHRRLGEESLCRLKEEVRRFAVDHTFKETAKKFGIHHSTVSGWVKAGEQLGINATTASIVSAQLGLGSGGNLARDGEGDGSDLTTGVRAKADDVFINWLKTNRIAGISVSLLQVKDKVADLFNVHGISSIEKTCKWFLLWKNRREEKQYVEGMEDEDTRRETQNLAYPPAFKLEVALHAKRYSQYAAAKIFSVARRRIFDWMRQIPKLEELIAKGHMKKMTGRGPKNRDIDQALYEWYCVRKAAGERPKSCQVQSKAREIYLARGYTDMKCSYGWFKRWSQRFQIQLRYSYDDDLIEWILSRFDANESVSHHDLQTHGLMLVRKEDPHFKASSGWAIRFCRRHNEYMNPDFTRGPRLPDHLEERTLRFRGVLQQLITEKKFSLDQIGCMDELSLHLSSTSIKERRTGQGTAHLRHAGMKGSQATVILATTASGTLLPPLLILKRDSATQNGGNTCDSLRVPDCEVIVILVESTSADPHVPVTERTILQWIQLVWYRHVQGPSLLIADTFGPHTAATTQRALVAKGSCLAIIPSACSANLQPLHRGIKQNFKEIVEMSYLKNSDYSNPSLDGRPQHTSIIRWVDQAYKALRSEKELIARSFVETDIVKRHCQDNPVISTATTTATTTVPATTINTNNQCDSVAS